MYRYKNAPDPLVNVIDLFGRLLIQTRQWVRHVIALTLRKSLILVHCMFGLEGLYATSD